MLSGTALQTTIQPRWQQRSMPCLLMKGEIYKIVDLTGRELLTGMLRGETTTIDISGLPAGTYLFKAGGLNEQILKVIKH